MTYCELFIPTVGTKHSHAGNMTFPRWELATSAILKGLQVRTKDLQGTD